MFAILAIGTAMSLDATERSDAGDSAVTAIDVALEPDAVMTARALADNAALRENFPQGFALDETHHAHITLLQRFARTDDLPKIYAAVEEACANQKFTDWKLRAFKTYYIPAGPICLAGIVIKPTPELIRLQQEVVDAVAPYAVSTATRNAFHTTPAEPDIHPSVIPYIAGFVPDQTGTNYNPHVTTGIGTKAFVEALSVEPFEAFTFSLTGASVYQLGDFGTARRELKSIPAKPAT